MFDVRRLVVLREIARCGSLRAAAATLNYTTSAVSQQILTLEREIGTTLLIRGPTGAQPTAAGRKLLEHAAGILAAIAAAERDLTRAADAPDVLRVASFASAAASILPSALSRFRSTHPGLRLQLVAADPDDAVALLREGAVDVAVITEVPGEPSQYPDAFTVPVYDDEFFVVLPTAHKLAGAAEVSLSALSADEWVVSSATGTCPDVRVFRNACQRAGFSPSVTFRSEDYPTMQGLVAANLGVSLVPSLAAAHARDDVAICRVAGDRPVRRVALATAAAPQPETALGVLMAFIRAAGARLATDSVYSVTARPSSVA